MASYLTTILERDLREITDAYKLEQMPRVLRHLAGQAANIYNSSAAASSLGIDHKTIQGYTRLLETIFLVRRMPAWRPGLGAREIHSPKVYVVDTGLLVHLLGADEQRIVHDPQVTGKMLENFVAMEIARHVASATTDVKQYHYRDGRDEVDVVLEARSGDIAAVEIKAAATVEGRGYRALVKLRDRRGRSFRAGIVIYAGAQTIPLSDRIWAVPVSGLWARSGAM